MRLFTLALPVATIAVGILNLDNCVIEKRIPIFLIVGGIIYLIKRYFLVSILKFIGIGDDSDYYGFYKRIMLSVDAVCILWLTIGAVWIMKISHHVEYYNESSNRYCDRLTYQLSHCLLIAGIVYYEIIYILQFLRLIELSEDKRLFKSA